MSQEDLFGQPTVADVTIRSQIACVKRELNLRQSVYPRRVAGGKMTQGLADRETLVMQAVLATLEKLEADQ